MTTLLNDDVHGSHDDPGTYRVITVTVSIATIPAFVIAPVGKTLLFSYGIIALLNKQLRFFNYLNVNFTNTL